MTVLLRSRALLGAVIVVAAHAPSLLAQAQTGTKTTAASPPSSTPTKQAGAQTKTPPPQSKAAPTQAKTAPAKAKVAAPPATGTVPPGQAKTPPSKAGATPAVAAQSKAAPPAAGGAAQGTPRGGKAVDATKGSAPIDTSPPVIIMREAFTYEGSGRRDPFLSLLTTNELRPALSDLKLNFIVYSAAGGSTASIRDNFAKKPVTARMGTQLGRMRVIAIHPNAVVFSIDEFGTNRRDSLVVKPDTTK